LLRPGKQVRVVDLAPALKQHALKSNGPMTNAPTGEKLEIDLDDRLDDILHQVMQAALDLEGGNRSRTARRLGISLRTVQRHLARLPADR
jgi:DNA-binding NtrC family response regulator